ncbi:MAG: hypothetical protein Fur0018_07480 [Anaerolineales bacterium]
MTFLGFPAGKVASTPIPEPFFVELLPQIDDLDELKVTLYALWMLNRMEGAVRYVRREDFTAQESLMRSLGETPSEAEAALEESLSRMVQRGTLLQADLDFQGARHTLFFVNTPKGRAAWRAIQEGQWRPANDARHAIEILPPRPTIYDSYEQNFGPLTPILAESLKEAEETYPTEWILDAMQLAVENNVRRWRYVEAILRRWQEEGRHERTHRRDSEETGYDKYTSGPYADFIER